MRISRTLSILFGLVVTILMSAAVPAASSEPPIAPSVARLFVGDEKVIEGPVTAAARDGHTVNLHLGTSPHDVRVSLILGLLSTFPPEPEQYYAGKTVRVVGTLRSFRGDTEIVIHDPEHIQVVDDTAPRVQSAPPAAAADVLTNQVRGLEERVRQLEHATPDPAGR